MKVTNCTQCGAVITDIRDGATFADCEYCGARFLVPHEPKPEPRRAAHYSPAPFRAASISLPYGARLVLIVIGVGMILLIVIGTIASVQQRKQRESAGASRLRREAEQRRLTDKPSTPYTNPAWTVSSEPPKPTPVINYQPRISWDGPNDLQYFSEPQVDISSVSDLTSEEIEKTVFKNRNVKLRVIINTEGEIDEVETISGHPILVEAATQSAKQTIFSARKKPTKRVLTYTFRLIKD